MVKLTLTNKNTNAATKGVARKLPLAANPATKGIAKKIPPKRTKLSHKQQMDSHAGRDGYVPATWERSRSAAIDEADSSFNATSSGDVYEREPGLGLDANGEIELKSGNTPAGLFSPIEGEGWDVPYTPEHISKDMTAMELAETSSKRAFETPEPRGLHNLFSPDAPRGSLDKKVVTHFVSDYGDNVPESAHEDNYTGRSIIAVVVKTFVPCYIVQMPEKVRARIYSLILFPNGKANAPRPFFSHLSSFRVRIPALLSLCKQIRDEASPIYYGNLLVVGTSLPNLLPWLRTLDPKTRAMIGKIKLAFDAWDHVDKTKEQQIRLRLKQFREFGIEVERARFDLVVQPQDEVRSLGGDLTDDE